MEQEQVIQRIKELGEKILPEGASLWLYGSRARGDARPDSDYDLLILLDKDCITGDDHDKYGHPFSDLGIDLDADISPKVYSRKEWFEMDYIPFHDSVENDKKLILRTNCEKRNVVVKHLVEKTQRTIADAVMLLDSHSQDGVIDIVYSAVHCAVAALFTHDGLLATNSKSAPPMFIEHYCNKGLIGSEYGVLYNDVRAKYEENNNDCFYTIDAPSLRGIVCSAKKMIDTIAEMVKE